MLRGENSLSWFRVLQWNGIDKDLAGVGGCQVARADSELKHSTVFHGSVGEKLEFSFTETRRFREEIPWRLLGSWVSTPPSFVQLHSRKTLKDWACRSPKRLGV